MAAVPGLATKICNPSYSGNQDQRMNSSGLPALQSEFKADKSNSVRTCVKIKSKSGV